MADTVAVRVTTTIVGSTRTRPRRRRQPRPENSMSHDTPAYALSMVVVVNSAIFPQTQRADPDITSDMATPGTDIRLPVLQLTI